MKFKINKNGQIQCPTCKSWCYLDMDHLGGPYHEFECCGRSFLIPIDFQNLERFKKGEEIEKPPDDWWLRNQ